MIKKDLHTLGLLACAAKIAAGTMFYFFIEFAKETCVSSPGAAAKDNCVDGEVRWSRSFFNAALLFFGMSFTMIPYYVLRHNKPGVSKLDRYTFINLIIPSLLEFTGQIMFMMGVKYIPMSLSLTLKGARVVFSALLLVVFLKRKLFAFHWLAIALTIAGLVVASIPSVIKKKSTTSTTKTSDALMGIGLVLAGEFIRSMRGVIEEKMMKKMKYDALLVVGVQGIYGLILSIPTLFVVSEITNSKGKPLEDLSTTLAMFGSSAIVIGLSATVPVTVPGLFIAGAYVTKLMSAVHNALTTILTNGLVWILAIIVHFIEPGRGSSLQWISLVQLLGFIMVLVASLIYDAMIRIPCFFTYPLDRAAASGAGTSEKSVLGIVSEADIVVSDVEEGKMIETKQ